MSLTNKEYLMKDKKTKAKELSSVTRTVVKHNRKHFIIVYEYNEKDPSKSLFSFNCANITSLEILSLMKQMMEQISAEANLKTN